MLDRLTLTYNRFLSFSADFLAFNMFSFILQLKIINFFKKISDQLVTLQQDPASINHKRTDRDYTWSISIRGLTSPAKTEEGGGGPGTMVPHFLKKFL
jgi:hypothetical protein